MNFTSLPVHTKKPLCRCVFPLQCIPQVNGVCLESSLASRLLPSYGTVRWSMSASSRAWHAGCCPLTVLSDGRCLPRVELGIPAVALLRYCQMVDVCLESSLASRLLPSYGTVRWSMSASSRAWHPGCCPLTVLSDGRCLPRVELGIPAVALLRYCQMVDVCLESSLASRLLPSYGTVRWSVWIWLSSHNPNLPTTAGLPSSSCGSWPGPGVSLN